MTNRRYQVFLSSTYDDMKEERRAVFEALQKRGYILAGMEFFGASGRPPWDVIKADIDTSDYVAVIIKGRYGSDNPETGKGYVESEYDYAKKQGLRPLVFVIGDPKKLTQEHMEPADRAAKLEKFKRRITETVAWWQTVPQLVAEVTDALHRAERTDPRDGWVRGTGEASEPQTKKATSTRASKAEEAERERDAKALLTGRGGALRKPSAVVMNVDWYTQRTLTHNKEVFNFSEIDKARVFYCVAEGIANGQPSDILSEDFAVWFKANHPRRVLASADPDVASVTRELRRFADLGILVQIEANTWDLTPLGHVVWRTLAKEYDE